MIKHSQNLYQLSDSTYAYVFLDCDDLGNAGIVRTDEGVVVIDTDLRTVDQLFDTILPQISDKTVKFLINSHHAFDHSSANCVYAQKGIPIIGSQACRETMMRDGEHNVQRWTKRRPDIGKILQEKGITIAPPNITFDRQLQLHLGSETIELSYHGHAHTPGDILIYLPKDQILFAGDLLWVGYFPNVREANVPNLIHVVNSILEIPVNYYIPGHGQITSDRNEFVRMRDFLELLYGSIQEMVQEGQQLEELKPFEETLVKENPDWKGRQYLTTAVQVIYQSLIAQTG